MAVPPYVPAVVLTLVVAVASDKLKRRGPFILMLLPITMIGMALHLNLRHFSWITIGYIIAIVAKVKLFMPPLL